MSLRTDELVDAGLYDPDAVDAPQRLELLTWLDVLGFTIAEMVEAHGHDALVALAAGRELRGEQRWSRDDLVSDTGIAPEAIDHWLRALGYPLDEPAARVFSDRDRDALRVIALAHTALPQASMERFARTLSMAMAQIASAVSALFARDVEAQMVERGASELERARANLGGIELLRVMPTVFDASFRREMVRNVERRRRERLTARGSRASDRSRLAVGFVDVVGYTPAATELGLEGIGALVDRLEAIGNEAVRGRDARVVKFIGDAAMFIAVLPADAVAIARDLRSAFEREAGVAVHGGIAEGEVLARGGDYYGPAVNLAARLAEAAVPGEVLVTRAVADHVDGLVPAGRRRLKGFDDPVEAAALSD